MNKIFLTIIFTFFSISFVNAANLSILRPSEGEKINGVVTVYWSVFNLGDNTANYQLQIKQSGCAGQGTSISGDGYTGVVQNGNYSSSVNTVSFSDGVYCLELCVKKLDETVECTHRNVNIVNKTNQPPVVNSYPSQLKFNTDNYDFKYKIQASDPDGDDIFYKLDQAPEFIYLDQDGIVGLTDYMRAGSHTVRILISDGLGATVEHSFVLEVEEAPKPTVTEKEVTTTITPKPSNDEIKPTNNEEEKNGVEVNLFYPNSRSVWKEDLNEIKWSIKNNTDIELDDVILDYALDGTQDFQEIIKLGITDDESNYYWDSSELSDNKYKIRISVSDNDGNIVASEVSSIFQIERDDKTVTEAPIPELEIIETYPADKEELSTSEGQISGNFDPDATNPIEYESVKIIVDGEDVTNQCYIDDNGFSCTLDEDLSAGTHDVVIEGENTEGDLFVKDWSFSIKDEEDVSPVVTSTPNNVTTGLASSINQQWIYLLCGFLIFILMFIGFFKLFSARKRSKTSVAEVSPVNDDLDGTQIPVDNLGFSPEAYDDQSFDFSSVGEHDVSVENQGENTIPDWLQEEGNNASAPVSPGGDVFPVANNNSVMGVDEGSELHESFGLTPSSDDDLSKQA